MLSFFPLDVLDEIWDVAESVSEGFLTYSNFRISDVRVRSVRSTSLLNYSQEMAVASSEGD